MVDLRFSDTELDAVETQIETFIADTVDAAGVDGAVIGLSGGVDSSLTATLAVNALGAEHVYGLVLPAGVSSDANMSDAERIAEQLGIRYDVIDIEPLVQDLAHAVPRDDVAPRAVGNARARVRGVLNYLVANHDGRVVLGTGNRSEAQVGYYTKYGDGAVDCHPIGDLYKAQVRQLAEHVDVPDRIVSKPATAELWADQTDEGELGVSYDVLDGVLALCIDGGLSPDATARELDVDREVVDRITALHDASEHKRHMPPSPGLHL